MAKDLYDYWFVQFDFPDENGKPYKSSGGKMVWNDELKREIPEGWENGIVSDLGTVVTGGTPSTGCAEYFAKSKSGHAWATPKDLSNLNGRYFYHGEADITDAGLKIAPGISCLKVPCCSQPEPQSDILLLLQTKPAQIKDLSLLSQQKSLGRNSCFKH